MEKRKEDTYPSEKWPVTSMFFPLSVQGKYCAMQVMEALHLQNEKMKSQFLQNSDLRWVDKRTNLALHMI